MSVDPMWRDKCVFLTELPGFEPVLEHHPGLGCRVWRRRYYVPESEREKLAWCRQVHVPGAHLTDKNFFKINPDWSADYNHGMTGFKPTAESRSPFNIAPHRGQTTCPYYEAFAPGCKLNTEFQSAWSKPMADGVPAVVTNEETRRDHIKRIGGDALLRNYLASRDPHDPTSYCLWCFQNDYLRFHLRNLESPTDGIGSAGRGERASASTYIQFRMIIAPTSDYKTAINRIMKQESFPVKRFAYVKISDSEVRGIYQTFSNNMIKNGHVSRYWRGEFQQSRCLNMDDVGAILGSSDVVQSGDWDSD